MKVAIVGASGQLGQCSLDAVLARGVAPEDVVAAVRSPQKLSEYAERGVLVRPADYNDPKSLAVAFEGVERGGSFHGRVGIGRRMGTYSIGRSL